jgi:pimeloyl-ACP methyl ester carboxylesterase
MKMISIALAVSTATFFAGAAQAAPPVKNIVLVHGAFADGSSWSKVVTGLQAKGFNVTAVQNPLTSLADDVATTKRALALQDGSVILVGHSWGGAVITEAGVDDKVVGLVYVSAYAPDVGETLDQLVRAYPEPPAITHRMVDKQGFVKLSVDAYVEKFMPDVQKAEARVHAATQGPLSGTVFAPKFTNAAWKTRPSWYIVARQDQVIAPDLERFFAKRMNAKTTEVDSSHVPMLSQSKKVVDVIVDAASNAKVAAR